MVRDIATRSFPVAARILPFDEQAARRYAELRAHLERVPGLAVETWLA